MRIPNLRGHSSDQVRVTLQGRTFYCGRSGTDACQAEYQRFVGEWVASGGVVHTPKAKSDLRMAEMLLSYVILGQGALRT